MTRAVSGFALATISWAISSLPLPWWKLRGKTFDESTMRAAGDAAVSEVTPISDVRGSADYRLQLAENIMAKFWFEVFGENGMTVLAAPNPQNMYSIRHEAVNAVLMRRSTSSRVRWPSSKWRCSPCARAIERP